LLKNISFIFLDRLSEAEHKSTYSVALRLYSHHRVITVIVTAIRRIRLSIRGFGILAVILIIISSYALFFYFQREIQEQVKLQLFEDRAERQLGSTQQIAAHMGSDLTVVLSILDGISNSKYLQEGQFYGQDIRQLATEKYAQMSKTVDRLFILNNEDIVSVEASNSSAASGSLAPIGNDLSFRPWVREARDTFKPVFSQGFEHLGEYRVIITNPVIDRETKQYLGLVGVSIPTVPFFEHYGNVHDINSEFLVALDKKSTLLAVGADENLVGLDFFGETTQDFINHNPTLNKITVELLQGKAGSAVYDYGRGERLTTYQPIYVADKPTYFLQTVTPTATIYSQIDPILLKESEKLALFLAGPIGASAILIIFLLFWNSSLQKEVKKRTRDLQESNRLLGVTNEQLKERERMQEEFINIAAHEMRTPIQPILGLSEVIRERILNLAKQLQKWEKEIVYKQLQDATTIPTRSDSIYRSSSSLSPSIEKIVPMVDVINRNAKRLEKLTSNLLDVSRIENNKSLELSKEKFDLRQKIRNVIYDINSSQDEKADALEIIYDAPDEPIMIEADKTRIFEVVSNLLRNAIKFTDSGTITITSRVEGSNAMVSIKDTGRSIDPELMPRLFTKFATKSETGTGLGLYLSKKIIEAHGGRIWAENNKDGKGATFAFTLPLLS
jgi:signal transduction histidine kinase